MSVDVGTNSDRTAIRNYYKDVKKTVLLSGDEQIELAIKAKKGDEEAFKKLIECNLRFVITIAKDYVSSGVPLEDLISEGNIGLMEAVKRFDETKGFRFISYAVWWVRQSIAKSINDTKSNIRLPINKINSINKITKVKERLWQELERPPNESELLDHTDVSENDMKSYMLNGNFEFHIDDVVRDTDDMRYEEMLRGSDYEEMEQDMNFKELRLELQKAMSTLSDRERTILTMYFGLNDTEPATLREIGKAVKLTNERVRQVMLEAIKRLRVFNKSVRLRDFVKMEF